MKFSELKNHIESEHPHVKPGSSELVNPIHSSGVGSVVCKICHWVGYTLESANTHTTHEVSVGMGDGGWEMGDGRWDGMKINMFYS